MKTENHPPQASVRGAARRGVARGASPFPAPACLWPRRLLTALSAARQVGNTTCVGLLNMPGRTALG